jgi:hypothetical protein
VQRWLVLPKFTLSVQRMTPCGSLGHGAQIVDGDGALVYPTRTEPSRRIPLYRILLSILRGLSSCHTIVEPRQQHTRNGFYTIGCATMPCLHQLQLSNTYAPRLAVPLNHRSTGRFCMRACCYGSILITGILPDGLAVNIPIAVATGMRHLKQY